VREITTPPDLTKSTASVQSAGLSVDGAVTDIGSTHFNVPLALDRVAIRITPFASEDPDISIGVPRSVEPNRLKEIKNTAAMRYQGVIASLLWKAPTTSLCGHDHVSVLTG